MTQKVNSLVLTLVSQNYKDYKYAISNVKNILKKNNISNYKVEKLSNLAIDFYFRCKSNIQNNLNNEMKLLNKRVDIYLQKNLNRKKLILACDMDMTVIQVETINLINKKFIKNKEIEYLTKKQ